MAEVNENKKFSNERAKAVFYLKTDIQAMYSAFKRVYENRIKQFEDIWSDNICYYVIMKDSFYEELEKNLMKIPISEDVSLVAHIVLKKKILPKAVNGNDAVIIRESELKSSLGSYVGKFMALALYNNNGIKNFNEEMYIEFSQAYGYFSMGSNVGRIDIFNIEDPDVAGWLKLGSGKAGYILHDCNYDACAYGDGRLMNNIDYNCDTDDATMKKIVVYLGKEDKCRDCGEIFYFDTIDPEYLFKLYRVKVLGYKI